VKYFFKKAIQGILPDSIIYRPKQGFRTPVVELFKGPLGDWGSRASRRRPHEDRLPRRERHRSLLDEHRSGSVDNSNMLLDGPRARTYGTSAGSRPSRPTRVVSRPCEVGARRETQ
jgi:hypothetical protein